MLGTGGEINQGGDQQTSTGQSSGRRMHDHIVIVKRIDAASPQFMRAATTGEVLREVSIEFVHPLPDGRGQVYKTLRIANATITSARMLDAGSKDASRRAEEISLTFERGNVEARDINGRLMPVERWLSIQR
jgi:type VI secretion system Hcp family effector